MNPLPDQNPPGLPAGAPPPAPPPAAAAAHPPAAPDPPISNAAIAARLDEVATMLAEQDANPYRVRAYVTAAAIVRDLDEQVADLWQAGGTQALTAIPGIGESLAHTLGELVLTGRLELLDRLRGEADPVALLASVPGIGPRLAGRLHAGLGIHSLEELELAAHDGRLAAFPGFGPRRVAAVRDLLARRLALVRTPIEARRAGEPPTDELLDVDREYRERAARGELHRIAPRRFNPGHEAWLPILHTQRGPRNYVALFSNTEKAHRAHRTHDWVVLYVDGGGIARTYTVVTAERGLLEGRRVVRGREDELLARLR